MSNDQIFETVITTQSADGTPHVAPMGVRYRDENVILMPFKPSTTLDNIDATGHAVLNIVTDTRVFAGAVTGRRHWMLEPADKIAGVRLTAALSHAELTVIERIDDPQRPVLLPGPLQHDRSGTAVLRRAPASTARRVRARQPSPSRAGPAALSRGSPSPRASRPQPGLARSGRVLTRELTAGSAWVTQPQANPHPADADASGGTATSDSGTSRPAARSV